ncbi:Glutamate decarboxylase 2 [Tilletia horrida]|uniref:Glutamate decarboxylase 2 n=1 Tax=Tilletia horrida TaxID=155126 RepID=A0AAN6JNI7_9BASI|nr:Glutamate decarboxylase 2 [Tilletia horrida]
MARRPQITDAKATQQAGEAGAPVVQEHTPSELQHLLQIDFPEGTQDDVAASRAGTDRVLASAEAILQNSVNHWTQGRFAAKLYSSTDAVGIASELLLAFLNANGHVYSAAPALSVIEVATVAKINQLIGYGEGSGGLTMPGGSASNRLSLTTAINNLLPSVQHEGMASLPQQPIVFTSDHSHYSIEQAAISAGIGLSNVRKVATDHVGRMDIFDLRRQIEACLQAGQRPFYINATAGTTVTGCYDDIRQIAALAEQYGCWLHVDGSWGGSVLWSSKYRSLLDGIHLAHSVTVNPHKGLRVPLQCSFLLVRDRKLLSANVVNGDYLFHEGQQYDIGATTTFCGRRSDALKLYLAWQMHGSKGLARMIDDALDSGRIIRQRVRENPNLQLILPRDENGTSYSVCFRFCPSSQTSVPSDGAQRLTPRQMVRPIHAEVLRRGHVMVDFAPIKVRVRPPSQPPQAGATTLQPAAVFRASSDRDDIDLSADADENGYIGEVFRLPLHPYGLSAAAEVLDEIVKVGRDLFGA